jgi:hypothetical protein
VLAVGLVLLSLRSRRSRTTNDREVRR